MQSKFYCLVVGSRSFSNYKLLSDKLDSLLRNYQNIVIVSGGANGADALAERYANEHGYETKIFPADWAQFGKRAGYIRNAQMHEFISKFANRGCVAFWDGQSRGTQHSFALAQEYSNPLRIIQF